MADKGASVDIRGLKELQGAFKQVDIGLPKELRARMKAIAEHVVGMAQQRMPFQTGEAAGGLRPRATERGASIAYPGGGAPWKGVKADYYPWLDFGGTTGRGHVANGHNGYGGSIKRALVKGGRYLYPAIEQSRGYILDEMDKAVEKVAEAASFETREGAV